MGWNTFKQKCHIPEDMLAALLYQSSHFGMSDWVVSLENVANYNKSGNCSTAVKKWVDWVA